MAHMRPPADTRLRRLSVVYLAFAQLRQRPLQLVLSLLLLALAVATLAFVMVVQSQFSRQLLRDVAGTDLVVGAKGSPLQLILATVYHVDVPTGNVPVATVAQLRANRLVARAVPVALGDNYRGFRIVGTEPAFLERYGARIERGVVWGAAAKAAPSLERTAEMPAVIGSAVARATGLRIDDRFMGAHGLAAEGSVHENAAYHVVGVLAPTGTVADRLVLTALESVWRVHEGDAADPVEAKILEEAREVTAVLVTYATPLAAALLPRQVNAEPNLMAAVPATELARLFAVAGVGIDVVRAFSVVLFIAGLLALFVATTNLLEARRYDIAIVRLLGASRARVAALLLVQAWLLGIAAVFLGLGAAFAALWAMGRWLAAARSFTLGPAWPPEVILVIVVALFVSTLAVLWPAWRAARMDVHETLAQG
ncbi:MAG TPA: FtsX-like permease family protein [Burkholderiaceae bacterium]|nr:FtsX-like permease family protein [Burkholderiaceae bacterium]